MKITKHCDSREIRNTREKTNPFPRISIDENIRTMRHRVSMLFRNNTLFVVAVDDNKITNNVRLSDAKHVFIAFVV